MGKHGRGSEPAAWKASGGARGLGLSSGFGRRRKRGRPREREEGDGEGVKIEEVCGERGGQRGERGGEGKETEWGTTSTKKERAEWASGQEEGAKGGEPSADEGKRTGAPSGGGHGGEWRGAAPGCARKAKADNENKGGRREGRKSKWTGKKPGSGGADKQGGEVEGGGGTAIDANGIKLQQKTVGGRCHPLHSGRKMQESRKNEEWASKAQVRIRKTEEGREKPDKGKARRGKKRSKTRGDNAARDSSEATGKRSRPKSAAGGATPSAQQGGCKPRGRRNSRPAPGPLRPASANPACATQPGPEPVPKHGMPARPEQELLDKHRTQARIEPGLSSKPAAPVQRRMPPFPKCLAQAVAEPASPGAVPYVPRRKRTPKGKEARQPNRARGVIRSKREQMNKQHKFRSKKRTHGEQPQGAEPRRAAKRPRTREEVGGEEKEGEEQGEEEEAPPQSARVGDKRQCLVKIKASPGEHRRTSVAGWEPTQGQRREGVVAPDPAGRPTGAVCGAGVRAVRGICKSAAAASSGRPKIIKRVRL